MAKQRKEAQKSVLKRPSVFDVKKDEKKRKRLKRPQAGTIGVRG